MHGLIRRKRFFGTKHHFFFSFILSFPAHICLFFAFLRSISALKRILDAMALLNLYFWPDINNMPKRG